MSTNFYEKMSDLRAAQTETHTLLKGVTEKLKKYIEGNDARHEDLIKFQVESSRNLASVAAIVQDMKKDIDRVVCTELPTLQKEQASQKATVKSHGWLIKAIVGVTLLAVLGGTVTTLATCDFSGLAHALEEESALVDTDVDREAR